MTHKVVVIAAMAVVVVAVAAVVLVAVYGPGRRVSSEPAAVPPGPTAPSVADVRQAASSRPAAREPARGTPPSVPVEPAADTGSDPTTPEQAEVDPAVLATSDPEALVKSLSDKQNRELYRLLREKAGERQMREARYNLLTDTRLQMMGLGSNNKLALNEAQKILISNLKEAYKPRMEDLLSELWTRQEEINRQVREAYRGLKGAQDFMAFREKNQALLQEQQDIQQQIDEVSRTLDEQYLADIRSFLTPEQTKELDESTVRRQGGGVIITRKTDGDGTQVTVGGGIGGGTVIVQPDSPGK